MTGAQGHISTDVGILILFTFFSFNFYFLIFFYIEIIPKFHHPTQIYRVL